jgi:hypothetical protein
VVSITITGEWSEKSKHDFAIAKFLVIPFVTQKSARSSSLFQSDSQHVGSPVERCDRLFFFHSSEYFATSRCDETGTPYSMFSVAVSSCDIPLPEGVVKFF